MLAAVAAALTLATATPALPNPEPHVLYQPCPDNPVVQGCSDTATNTVYLTTRSRYAKLHEYGHITDHQSLDDVERGRFEQLAHLTGPWWPQEVSGASPGEEYADAYAMCRMHANPDPPDFYNTWWPARTGYLPASNRAFQATCRFIKRAVASPSTQESPPPK